MDTLDTAPEKPDIPKTRLYMGTAVFIAGQCAPLLVPVVISMDLSTEWTTILSGALLAGIPEIAILGAIAILGKEGFAYLKSRVKGVFKRFIPDTVSRTRFRVGISIFLFTMFGGWIAPYILLLLELPRTTILPIAITGDVLFILSIVILGGGFWDKLRGLVTYSAPHE